MTPGELERGYHWVYDQFYSWKHILTRWPKARCQVAAYLEFNLLYRKFGKITCHLGKWVGMRRLAKLAKAVAYPTLKNRAGRSAPGRPPAAAGSESAALTGDP